MTFRGLVRSLTLLLATPAPCALAPAQSSSTAPRFDIADVHTSPHVTFPFMDGGNLHGDRYALRQASIADMIAEAYRLDTANVQGGPSMA